MKKLGLYVLLSAGLTFGVSSLHKEALDPSKVKDTTFILELNQDLVGDKNALKKEQQAVLNTLNSTIGFNFKYINNYEHAINALVIKANSQYKDVLKRIPNVSRVVVNQEYRFSETTTLNKTNLEEGYVVNETKVNEEKPKNPSNNHNYSADSMNVPLDGEGETATIKKDSGKGTLVAILDGSFLKEHSYFKELGDLSYAKYSKEEMQEFIDSGNLNARPLEGKEMGQLGSLYYNQKIPFYYDYGGSTLNNFENDYDVYSPYDAHGTHVATSAVGNGISGQGGSEDSYDGIAPAAQVALMKVFRENIPENPSLENPASIGATDLDVLEALEDCAVLKVDAVNMSLGSDLDDFSNKSASATAFSNLKKQGCMVNISAGNAGKDMFSTMGPYMYWTTDMVETGIIGSYANDYSANIIASSTLEKQHFEKAISLNINGVDYPVEYKDEAKTPESTNITPEELRLENLDPQYKNENGKFEYVVVPKYGSSADYADIDAKGKIAIVDRGENSFSAKATAAKEAGAIALVVINNDPSAIEFNFGMAWGDSTGYTYPEIPVVFVLNRDRSALRSQDKGELSIALDQTLDNANKYKLSDFSSDGGTYDLRINPTITAPGTNILAGVPGSNEITTGWEKPDPYAYEYMSGTSMAAPNFTGSVASIMGYAYERIDNDASITNKEEAKLNFAKSLSSRVMSTANIYTKDNLDVANKETGEMQVVEEDVAYSPRRQGAGIVDVTKASQSEVYIEGLSVKEDGSWSDKGIGYGKIELKNNDLIKNGQVAISFKAHNETNKDVNYKAKVVLTRPETKEYYNYESNHKKDEEGNIQEGKDKKFEGHIFQSNSNTVIKEVTQDVVFPKGSNKVSLNTISLTSEEKKELDDLFENGTYLEGYVIFESQNEDISTPDLNVPFMGFYNEYEAGDAIEPFDFEKEEGRFYPSDLVNYVGYGTSLNLTNMDMGSTITTMSRAQYDSLSGNNDLLQNKTNLKNFSNQITIDKETNTLYAGGANSDVIYINAFVLRSVESSRVTITDSLNQVVQTIGDDRFIDILNEGENLYKSHIGQSYIGSGVMAHRATCEIPLYQKNNIYNKIPDGKYKLKIELNLLAGGVQSKEYNLVIDSQIPEIIDRSIITKKVDGSDIKYLRVKYKETYLPGQNNGDNKVNVAINGGNIDHIRTHASEDIYYIDIKVDDIYALEDDAVFGDLKLTLDIQDGAYNKTISMFYLDDFLENDGSVLIRSDELTPGSIYEVEYSENSTNGINLTYDISFVDADGFDTNLNEDYEVTLAFNKPYDFNTLLIYENVSGNKGSEIEFEVVNENTIKFMLSKDSNSFTVVSEGYISNDAPTYPSDNTLGIILGTTIPGGVILIGLGVFLTLYLLKKKKGHLDNKEEETK